MEERTISILEFFNILKTRFKLIITITIITTALAFFLSYFVITPKYEASTKLFIGKVETAGNSYNQSDVLMYQKLMKTYSEIIKTKDLIEAALKNVDTSDDADKVLSKLTVVSSSDTQILKIVFKDINAVYAADIVNSITNEFINRSSLLVKNANVTIIEKVATPTKPVSPNKELDVIIGCLLGIIIGVSIVLLEEILNNTFKNKKEVEQYLDIPVLGVIPMFENNNIILNNRNKIRSKDKPRTIKNK